MRLFKIRARKGNGKIMSRVYGERTRAKRAYRKAVQRFGKKNVKVQTKTVDRGPRVNHRLPIYQQLIQEGEHFGLEIQGDFQTTGGNHSRTSYHYQDRATDFGDANNSLDDMQAYQRYVYENASKYLEFFYDMPLPGVGYFFIKNGQIITGKFGGHADHIHVAR